MKVKQLIAKLSKMDKDADVLIHPVFDNPKWARGKRAGNNWSNIENVFTEKGEVVIGRSVAFSR